jgi:signal transduction histidine kinase
VVPTDERALSFWATPLADGKGAPSLRMLAVRDVTSQRAAERARGDEVVAWQARHEAAEASYASLRALHDELVVRRDEAEKLNTELRTLDGMKSDLLANVSHELQTPLVSIRGYTEMILKGRLGTINEEQKKGLTLSLRNIDRLIAMIDNLLGFARMDRESEAMRLQTFPLSGIVDEALALLAQKIQAKSIVVERHVDDALTVRADRDKILQVFLNVLGNAVKFNRERGSIEVTAQPGKPGFALVSVRDTGLGIAKEDLERVFDRFYQAEASGAPKGDGTGIGLAIVRNILRQHGCIVHATSEPGQGTVLSFTLPLAEARAEKKDAASDNTSERDPMRAGSQPEPPLDPNPGPRRDAQSERPACVSSGDADRAPLPRGGKQEHRGGRVDGEALDPRSHRDRARELPSAPRPLTGAPLLRCRKKERSVRASRTCRSPRRLASGLRRLRAHATSPLEQHAELRFGRRQSEDGAHAPAHRARMGEAARCPDRHKAGGARSIRRSPQRAEIAGVLQPRTQRRGAALRRVLRGPHRES